MMENSTGQLKRAVLVVTRRGECPKSEFIPLPPKNSDAKTLNILSRKMQETASSTTIALRTALVMVG
jgi:hypothetical protein